MAPVSTAGGRADRVSGDTRSQRVPALPRGAKILTATTPPVARAGGAAASSVTIAAATRLVALNALAEGSIIGDGRAGSQHAHRAGPGSRRGELQSARRPYFSARRSAHSPMSWEAETRWTRCRDGLEVTDGQVVGRVEAVLGHPAGRACAARADARPAPRDGGAASRLARPRLVGAPSQAPRFPAAPPRVVLALRLLPGLPADVAGVDVARR